MYLLTHEPPKHEPWNKGKITGQKPPLKLQEIWAIRFRLQLNKQIRDLALFNLAIDSKLRACDLVSLRVSDVLRGKQVVARATVMQRKTQRPVQFEIMQQARESLLAWIRHRELRVSDFLFPSRYRALPHISTRQYRLVVSWVSEVGLNAADYGTHSLRQTKATLIYRRTKNLRAVQLLLGHQNLQSVSLVNASSRSTLGVTVYSLNSTVHRA